MDEMERKLGNLGFKWDTEDETVEMIRPEEAASSEIHYFDDDNNIVSKDQATHVTIIEYDKDGNRINEIWGTVNQKEDSKKI